MSPEAETIDAKTIVELIRAQNWPNGVLLVGETDAIRLVATALRVAEDRGVIDGMERMSASSTRPCRPRRWVGRARQQRGLALHCSVMAGLVPAIHVFTRSRESKAWMPGTSPGMTECVAKPALALCIRRCSNAR